MSEKEFNISINDLMSLCDYTYEMYYDCDEACDDICRCGIVENIQILKAPTCDGSEVDYIGTARFNFAKEMRCWQRYEPSLVEKYSISRIGKLLGIEDVSKYSPDIGSGYYGEEVWGVSHQNAQKICEAIREMLVLESEVDKIRYVLNLEYSYLIDDVKNVDLVSIHHYSPVTVMKNKGHMERIKQQYGESLVDVIQDFPIGVVLDNGDGQARLIDGYHRSVAKLIAHGEALQPYITLTDSTLAMDINPVTQGHFKE